MEIRGWDGMSVNDRLLFGLFSFHSWRTTDPSVGGRTTVVVEPWRDALVSPVDCVTYGTSRWSAWQWWLQVISRSAGTDTLMIISQTSSDHRFLIEFHKPIIDYEKNQVSHQLRHVYLSVIRLILEYCSAIWHHSLTKAQAESLEADSQPALNAMLHILHTSRSLKLPVKFTLTSHPPT